MTDHRISASSNRQAVTGYNEGPVGEPCEEFLMQTLTNTQPASSRILFVDDESSIRLTLPPVLQEAGFDVQVAETVSDAMFEINSNCFDVLISDLNIGEEGDGFLVTSAMRQIQPNCLNFILTGYPAFETALQAIHSQVDDYLVKPVEVEALVSTVREKLAQRKAEREKDQRLASVLKENANLLTQAVQPKRTSRKAVDPQNRLALCIMGLIDALEKQRPTLEPKLLQMALDYGKQCRSDGYSATRLAEGFIVVQEAAYDLLQRNLITLNSSLLVADLRRFHSAVSHLMAKAMEGFCLPKNSKKRVSA